ncbi:MAG: 2-dehydro-3-deoxygalactonokinase, partial [Pseudomonadota bacterium]
EIVSFRTFMSGELFQTLGAHTVLRHSLSASGTDPDMDLGAFDAAVSDTLSRPETLAGALFTLRAADLLTGQSATVTRARLSGALIGAELAAAKPYWLGQRVAIVGSDAVSALYGRALAAQGVTSERCDAGAITRAGLISAYTSV